MLWTFLPISVFAVTITSRVPTILSRHTGSITEPDGAMNRGGPGGVVFTPWLSDPTHVLTLYIGAVVDLEIAVVVSCGIYRTSVLLYSCIDVLSEAGRRREPARPCWV